MFARNAEKIDAYVGRRVRMQRLARGMSQEGLAKKLGLSFQQVQKYEKGANRISASRMHRIAEVLEVPVTSLFEGLPDAAKGKSGNVVALAVSNFAATKEGLALIMAFSKIEDANVKRGIVNLVRELAEKT